jgi:DNA-binding transcriptional regulator YiaG
VCPQRVLLLIVTERLDSIIQKALRRRALPAPAARRLIREQAKLTQENIAEALGGDRASVSRWESGQRSPRGAMLDAYADLLDRLQREVLG